MAPLQIKSCSTRLGKRTGLALGRPAFLPHRRRPKATGTAPLRLLTVPYCRHQSDVVLGEIAFQRVLVSAPSLRFDRNLLARFRPLCRTTNSLIAMSTNSPIDRTFRATGLVGIEIDLSLRLLGVLSLNRHVIKSPSCLVPRTQSRAEPEATLAR